GTSGRTHGDKKEIRPATKAASGRGVVDIREYCNNRRKGGCPLKKRCSSAQNVTGNYGPWARRTRLAVAEDVLLVSLLELAQAFGAVLGIPESPLRSVVGQV